MSTIHSTAIIGKNVVIEEDVEIGPYCVIGYPAEWKGKENHDFGVLIKSGSRLTGMVTVDSGAERQTVIGKSCYLMKHSHVGHDAHLGNNVTLSPGAKIGGHCEIGSFVNIGLNASIHQKIAIPNNCMIGANAFVGKQSELRPGYKYAGVPVRELGPNFIKTPEKVSVTIQYSTSDLRFLETNLRQVSKFSDDIIVTMCERYYNGETENAELVERSVKIVNSFENVRLEIIPWHGRSQYAAYYHNMSRYTGYRLAKYDWVLFLDSDEIVTDEFGAWFDANSGTDCTYVFGCNWYFRSPHNRAKREEGAGCLMRKSHCADWDVFNNLELKQFYERLYREGRLKAHDDTPVYGLTGKPMVHHFSWVRNRTEMLTKVQNWGHFQDKNWTELVLNEFTHPFNGTDFVHNYEYDWVENIFNIPTEDLE